MRRTGLLLLAALLAAGCTSSGPSSEPRPGQVPPDRPLDAIVVAGAPFRTGTRVVTWDEPGGYDAYLRSCHFDPQRTLPSRPARGCDTPRRFSSRRTGDLPGEVQDRIAAGGWDLETLRRRVHQFVIHFDVCSTSRRCFEVLHDVRGLSVHFMLDLDGTVYQTLDLVERARHAGRNNDVSVGIEIANIGCYRDPAELEPWYGRDATGRLRVTLPEAWGDGGIRSAGFVARPARDRLLTGSIHGDTYHQYDFTEEQYRALVHLVGALHRALPDIALTAPRTEAGEVSTALLPEGERTAFRGLVGHYHVSAPKVDPGPAFDWERVLREAGGPGHP